jgi:glycosyltransferase involved in cell wall biosynthesis
MIYNFLQKKFSIKDLDVLPRFNNYESLINIPTTLDLRARYKPLVFIMLYVGKLSYDCDLPVVLNAARIGLRNPHIGLIVLGDGPARRDLEKQAEVLNIKEQVIFEPKIKDIIPYLKSANVLLVPDTDLDSESLVLQGAASGIPMIMARTPAREDVFRDGESALFCSADNVDEFSLKLNILMNDIPLRRHMVELSQDMIRAKFHDNPAKYRNAYRDSIEQVLFIEQNKD